MLCDVIFASLPDQSVISFVIDIFILILIDIFLVFHLSILT